MTVLNTPSFSRFNGRIYNPALIFTLTNSKQSPVIFILWCPTLTVYLYSPSEASFVDRLCNSILCPPICRCPPADLFSVVAATPIRLWPIALPPLLIGVEWFGTCWLNWLIVIAQTPLAMLPSVPLPDAISALFRFALGCVSSDVDEARELHDPAWFASSRTGDAFRRIVPSINCFA